MKSAQFDMFEDQVPSAGVTYPRKRPRGRPPGPRGFVFYNRFRGAQAALAACVRWLNRARSAAKCAVILRRMNGARCAVARYSAIEGRAACAFALACYLSAQCYFNGGLL